MQTKFWISGMHCASCAEDIKETLEETAGVNAANVSYDDKFAVVEYDNTIVQEKTLEKKIQDLGYEFSASGDNTQGATV